MKLGTSPITHTIYAGKTRVDKKGNEVWQGEKVDVTDSAIRAVFEWFMYNSQSNDGKPYEVNFPSIGTLTYVPKGYKDGGKEGDKDGE